MRLGELWPVADKQKAFKLLQTSTPIDRMKQGSSRSGQNHHDTFRLTDSQGNNYFVKTMKAPAPLNIRKPIDHYIQNALALLTKRKKLTGGEDPVAIQFPKTIGMVKSLKPTEIDNLTTLYQVLGSTEKLLQHQPLTTQETQQLAKRYGQATPEAAIAHYAKRYPKLINNTGAEGVLVKLSDFKSQLYKQFSQQYLLTRSLNPKDKNNSYIAFVMEDVDNNCQQTIKTNKQSALSKWKQLQRVIQQTLGITFWDNEPSLKNTILNEKGLFIIDPSYTADKHWFQKVKELLHSK